MANEKTKAKRKKKRQRNPEKLFAIICCIIMILSVFASIIAYLI